MRRPRSVPSALLLAASTLVLTARPARAQAPKAAEPSVAAANAAVLTQLPFADRQDFDDATRGFVGRGTPNVSVALTRDTFEAILLGRQTLAQALQQKAITAAGNPDKLTELMSLMDDFDASFPVVEPSGRRP